MSAARSFQPWACHLRKTPWSSFGPRLRRRTSRARAALSPPTSTPPAVTPRAITFDRDES